MLQLSDVKEFLKVDNNLEDRYISLLILLSKEMCANYLRVEELPIELPMAVNQACLLVIGHFYEKRNDTEPIPQVVYRLLDPYRKDGF